MRKGRGLTMKILLNLNYQRQQWVRLVAPLFNVAEIHWLRFISRDEDDCEQVAGHVYHYWSQYKCAHEIIADIKPDAVILMDNLAPLSIALNYASKRKGITTYYLQHGLFATYKDYILLEKLKKTDKAQLKEVAKAKAKVNFNSLWFVKKSLGLHFWKPSNLLYLLLSKTLGTRKAAKHVLNKERVPDYYLCYSHENATIHKELDRINTKKIRIVGNPEMEAILKVYTEAKPFLDEPYWLLIDQSLSGSDIGEGFITRERHINIYNRLADWAKAANVKLIIKLHPGNYHINDLPENDTIIWVRDIKKLASLIKGARHCIGFFSSLLLPCMQFKPVTLIRLFNHSFYERYKNLPNTRVIDDCYTNIKVPAESQQIDRYRGDYSKALCEAVLSK